MELQRAVGLQVHLVAPYKIERRRRRRARRYCASSPVQNAPAAMPASLQTISALIDRLDAALALASAIQESRKQDDRHRQLALERRAPADMPGVFAALREISHWGASFQPGALIDSTVINVSMLYRFLVARCVVAVDRPAEAT